MVKKTPHRFKAELFADGPRGRYFQIWRSEKYPRLTVDVSGTKGKPDTIFRRYWVDGYTTADAWWLETLAEAIDICRKGIFLDERYPRDKKLNFITDPDSLEYSGARIPVPRLSGTNLQNEVGPRVRRIDKGDQQKAGRQPDNQLHKRVRERTGGREARDEGRSIHKVRRVKKRSRV